MNKKEKETKETKETKENKSHIFIYILLIIGLIIIYSRYIATTGIQIKEYSVINNKIPENTEEFGGEQHPSLPILQLSSMSTSKPLLWAMELHIALKWARRMWKAARRICY